ncbi:hypothetical protein A9Q81_20235 [Gammaproteobacteria bacterium 42_54_T18]|nr:hypothetical protein A9Q81_20235 [Gammaproteobacteria bacterium 42_54_T18]
MKTLRLLTLLLLPLWGVNTTSFAQENSAPEWNLIKVKDGVQVYTQAVDGYDLKAFKGVVTVEASLENLYNVFLDVENMTGWMHTVTETRPLEKVSDTEFILYTTYNAPWPASDRDSVVKTAWEQDATSLELTNNIHALPDYMGKASGFVRMPYVKAYFKFVPISATQTTVIYEAHADPGGILPAWIVNMVALDTPLYTLINLKTILKKERKEGDFPFANYPALIASGI